MIKDGKLFALYDEDKSEIYAVGIVLDGVVRSKNIAHPKNYEVDDNMTAQLFNPTNICAITASTGLKAVNAFEEGKPYKFDLPKELVWDIWKPI